MENCLARTGRSRQYSPTEQREEQFLDHWTYQPVFYLAQSACTAFMAINGLRLLVESGP